MKKKERLRKEQLKSQEKKREKSYNRFETSRMVCDYAKETKKNFNQDLLKKHDRQTKNVTEVRSILRDIRDVKREESKMRNRDVKQNLEREKNRVDNFKSYIMNKDLNKTDYLNQRKERLNEIKNLKQNMIH